MANFFIKTNYQKYPKLIVKLADDYIDLKGKDSTEIIGKSKNNPDGVEVKIRAATQTDLELLHSGQLGDYSRLIGKKVEVSSPPVPTKPVDTKLDK